MFTKMVRCKPDIMPLNVFWSIYEKGLSVRDSNMKLLLGTVTYIAIKEGHRHNYNRHSHVHNAMKKIPHA